MTAYALAVRAGERVVPPAVRAATERHLADLDRTDLIWRPEVWIGIAEWAEKHLRVLKSGEEEPFRFLEWFAFAAGAAVSWFLPSGRLRFREVSIEVARGAGKSTSLAALMCHRLASDEWRRCRIYAVAQTTRQAKQCLHAPISDMAALSDLPLRPSSTTNPEPYVRGTDQHGGELRMLPAMGGRLQGLVPSMWVLDELGETKDPDWLEAVEQSLSKDSRCQLWSITTPPPPNLAQASAPYMSRRSAWEGAIDGSRDDVLAVWYGIPEEAEIEEEEWWPAAYPAMGEIKTVEDYRRDYEAAKHRDDLGAFELRQCCRPTLRGTTWCRGEDVQACELEAPLDPFETFAGRPVYAAIDISTRLDITSCALACRVDAHVWLWWHHWIPRPERWQRSYAANLERWGRLDHCHVGGETVDYDHLVPWVRSLCERLDVREIACDVTGVLEGRQALLELSAEPGIPITAVAQDRRHMSGAVTAFRDHVTGHRIRFSPDEVFRLGMMGVNLTFDGGERPYIEKARSTSIVDPVVAAVMASKTLLTSEVAQSALEGGEMPL